MAWLLIPIADRTKARKLVRAIDVLLGYPRTCAESELVRHGAGPHAAIVHTETQCEVRVNLVLGAIAVSLDGVVDALRGRTIDIDGEQIRIRIDDLGWQVRANLPGNESDWQTVQPRDGGAGSTTGEPVP